MALPYLTTPVRKVIYLDSNKTNNNFYVTGINALANYTNINGEGKQTFALYHHNLKDLIDRKNKDTIERVNCTIQIWKYDPGNLAENRFVDPLSLYLSLIDNEDERVRKELKNLLDELW